MHRFRKSSIAVPDYDDVADYADPGDYYLSWGYGDWGYLWPGFFTGTGTATGIMVIGACMAGAGCTASAAAPFTTSAAMAMGVTAVAGNSRG